MLDPQPTDLDLIDLFSLEAEPLVSSLGGSNWVGYPHCVMRVADVECSLQNCVIRD